MRTALGYKFQSTYFAAKAAPPKTAAIGSVEELALPSLQQAFLATATVAAFAQQGEASSISQHAADVASSGQTSVEQVEQPLDALSPKSPSGQVP